MLSSSLPILLTGSSGFIGSHLKVALEREGFFVCCLKRGDPRFSSGSTLFWDPVLAHWNRADFEGFQAVIHLAGESIASGRWTEERKRKLWSSRCETTARLSDLLCSLSSPPQLLISASAVGFYGNQPGSVLTEESPRGEGFLADLCVHWELAAEKVRQKGIRLIHSRLGLVLGKGGGILAKMLPLFRWGLGGRLGSGEQIVSWISLIDLLRGIQFCLKSPSIQGAVNFVAPYPVSQVFFAKTLAHHVNRPACFSTPAWLLRGVLGEMADQLLLSSQMVEPKRLLSHGFLFTHPDLNTAFQEIVSA